MKLVLKFCQSFYLQMEKTYPRNCHQIHLSGKIKQKKFIFINIY